jgi:hypothetical protein
MKNEGRFVKIMYVQDKLEDSDELLVLTNPLALAQMLHILTSK